MHGAADKLIQQNSPTRHSLVSMKRIPSEELTTVFVKSYKSMAESIEKKRVRRITKTYHFRNLIWTSAHLLHEGEGSAL